MVSAGIFVLILGMRNRCSVSRVAYLKRFVLVKNRASMNGLYSAYGYCLGERYILERNTFGGHRQEMSYYWSVSIYLRTFRHDCSLYVPISCHEWWADSYLQQFEMSCTSEGLSSVISHDFFLALLIAWPMRKGPIETLPDLGLDRRGGRQLFGHSTNHLLDYYVNSRPFQPCKRLRVGVLSRAYVGFDIK